MNKYIRYTENGLQKVSKVSLEVNKQDGIEYFLDNGHSINAKYEISAGDLNDVLKEGDLLIINSLPYIIDVITIQKTICCQNTIINEKEINSLIVLTNSELMKYGSKLIHKKRGELYEQSLFK